MNNDILKHVEIVVEIYASWWVLMKYICMWLAVFS